MTKPLALCRPFIPPSVLVTNKRLLSSTTFWSGEPEKSPKRRKLFVVPRFRLFVSPSRRIRVCPRRPFRGVIRPPAVSACGFAEAPTLFPLPSFLPLSIGPDILDCVIGTYNPKDPYRKQGKLSFLDSYRRLTQNLILSCKITRNYSRLIFLIDHPEAHDHPIRLCENECEVWKLFDNIDLRSFSYEEKWCKW
ncbi:uncharacterized protein EV154DRAFT_485169 [Mucor mucedo]|uniref:uncharacterized protein n=1 Tax=Mucor mucedo TaxID=29922 RepID=UPI0022200CF0|nr:uncharacterized protein EV154DRAFT_485169 [Mucor mucedo]KAI7886215.1 hypothetical protein EV154DRAFT_485169 [Mucor mucedo]